MKTFLLMTLLAFGAVSVSFGSLYEVCMRQQSNDYNACMQLKCKKFSGLKESLNQCADECKNSSNRSCEQYRQYK